MNARALTMLIAVLLAGCASAQPARLAHGGMPEAMCIHCNCLMPAGTDPNGMCPVCDCGKLAHECVRGE